MKNRALIFIISLFIVSTSYTQETIEIVLNNPVSYSDFVMTQVETLYDSVLNKNVQFDSICIRKVNECLYHCYIVESMIELAEEEANKLNIKNANNGFFYVIEYENNNDLQWSDCLEYINSIECKALCNISTVKVTRKLFTIVDSTPYYSYNYEEDIEYYFGSEIDTKRNHKKACKEFEKVLKRIQGLLKKDITVFWGRDCRIIWYFEDLTGIGQYTIDYDLGVITPNKEDYDKWIEWYGINNENIRWEKETKSIILLKDRDPNQ